MKAAISALEGNADAAADLGADPGRSTTRRSKDGENYWSDLPDNFFTPNEFPPCGVNITGRRHHGARTTKNTQ